MLESMLSEYAVAVKVVRPAPTGRDAFGITTYGTSISEMVEDVLVDAAGDSAQAIGTGRERRPKASLTLYFPKGYDASLLGCSVELLPPCPAAWAGSWDVVGDPMPYDPALTPGPWNREVRVERASA